jgi:hypothetical protein
MNIIIKESPLPPTFVCTFVVEAKFMSGDADAFHTEVYLGSRDQIEPLVTFLLAINEKLKFQKFFRLEDEEHWKDLPCAYVVEDYDLDIPKDIDTYTLMEWPMDVMNNDYHASLEEWKLYWYNALGQKCDCEIVP